MFSHATIIIALSCVGFAYYLHKLSQMKALYEIDEQLIHDHQQEITTIRQNASLKHRKAQFILGMMYYRGINVVQDKAMAFFWLNRAADAGEKVAQFNLGIFHANGSVTPRDFIQAYKWLSIADNNSGGRAAPVMRWLFRRMSPEQVTEARLLANNWHLQNKPVLRVVK
jgi:TPR repeat protein